MAKPLIILPIEIKVREFHAKLLFALTAVERGFDVMLGEQGSFLRTLDWLDHGLYLDKSVAVTKEDWFAKCRRLGHLPVAWDEEGLVFRSADVYRKGRCHIPSLMQAARFFAWGPVHAAAVLGKAPAARDRVVETGNPRFDLLRPEYRPFYTARARAHEANHGRLILVNTNFGYVNHFKGEAGVRDIMARYPLAEEREHQKGWWAFQQIGFTAFRDLLPVLSRAFPDRTIMVRPSPSEAEAPWRQAGAPLGNVVVSADGSVDEWIPAADAVVHFNCTTGVEAFLMDVPAIAFRAATSDAYESELPNGVSRHAFTAEEVVSWVRRAIRSRAPGLGEAEAEPGGRRVQTDAFADETTRRQWRSLADRYITAMSGPTASERIVDALQPLAGSIRRERTFADCLNAVKSNAVPWVVNAFRRRAHGEAEYERRKFPGLDLGEVESCMHEFQAITGRFKNTTIRDLGRTRFLITED
jgi:surface carbohydrate biosynthesis protein